MFLRSLHQAWMTLAALSLYFGFVYKLLLVPFFLSAFLILNLFFFLSSWAKSTTPPLSNLILLKIGLSSHEGPLLDIIARETYKNLWSGERLKAFLVPLSSGLLAKVCLLNCFLVFGLYELSLLYVLVL